MSSIESFDELEQRIKSQVEEALQEIREDFLGRLASTTERLDESVNSQMAEAREQAASAASVEFEDAKAAAIAEALEAKEAEMAEILAAKDEALAEAERAKEAMLAEFEEAKAAAIAGAIEAKEGEFSEMLAAKDASLGEAEEARTALLAEAEESKLAAIAEALEAKESEFNEVLAGKDSAIHEIEQAKEAALAEAEEAREAAVAEARAEAERSLAEALDSALQGLHQTIARIDGAQTQTEALEALLAGCAGFASRSILFLTREDGLQGWGGQGFDTEEGRLQDVHFDYEEGTAWSDLTEGRGTVELSDDACEVLCRVIDGSQPREGVLIPMVLRDRLAAALYADRLEPEDSFHLRTLQILAYVAGQALETLPMRGRTATATLRMVTEAPADEPGLELWQFLAPDEPMVEEVEEPVAVPAEPEELAAEEVAAEPAPQAWKEPAEVPETESEAYTGAEETGFQVEAPEEIEPKEPEPIADEVIETPPAEVEPPVEAAPPVEVAPPPAEVAPPAAAGAEVAPPEDVDGPGWAFTTRRFDSESGEDATHEEARRLARLLVTEIKLYNEEQVEEGRRGRNIYRTLKEDIDRSRQIYDERVDEAIRADTDYFKDELVKILAAGDAEVLGL